MPAVFEYLFTIEKIKNLDCITPSGGGICLTMFLIWNQTYIKRINSITMFGCQSCEVCFNKKNYIKVWPKVCQWIENHEVKG